MAMISSMILDMLGRMDIDRKIYMSSRWPFSKIGIAIIMLLLFFMELHRLLVIW